MRNELSVNNIVFFKLVPKKLNEKKHTLFEVDLYVSLINVIRDWAVIDRVIYYLIFYYYYDYRLLSTLVHARYTIVLSPPFRYYAYTSV